MFFAGNAIAIALFNVAEIKIALVDIWQVFILDIIFDISWIIVRFL